MPLELAIRVIDEAVREGTLSMKFQCRGEPLLHPFIVEIVDYAKKSGIIEVMFNSNCTLLTPEMSLHLINAGLDKIICSVDTHDPYYYAKLRKGGNLDQTYRNINNLRQIRDKLGSKTPYIRIQMIDMKETHDMLPDTIKFWEPIADEISVVDFLDFHRIEHAEPVPNWCCNQPWQRLLVLADGNVIPCTGLYCDEKVVGNIYERSLKEIWNSREMRFIRECHRNGKSHLLEMCRICPLRRRYIE
jgi:radical SAM protein with 4Fe4S-binding SPASM domain